MKIWDHSKQRKVTRGNRNNTGRGKKKKPQQKLQNNFSESYPEARKKMPLKVGIFWGLLGNEKQRY